ncbi:MAG: hypothetical protein NTV33_04105 [Coprothermobacterota bacterium]|nr:hypothetical protein [Coprothermobacterota bacterium]
MRKWVSLLLLAAITLTGCSVDLSGLLNPPRSLDVPRMAEEVAAVRQLDLLQPIPCETLDPQQLEVKLAEMNEQEADPAQTLAAEKVMKFLGLLPAGEDLQAVMDSLYGEQILGFYDPQEGRLYLVDRSGGSAGAAGAPQNWAVLDQERITVAHELVHGLTDQHFDLLRFDEPKWSDDDDTATAVDCLIEGDASLGETLYLTQEGQDWGSLLGLLLAGVSQDSSQLDAAPPYIRDSLLFPYQAGLLFVQTLYEVGGWTAVDKAYEEPPTSTEQILHPQKYIQGNDPPLAIPLPSSPPALADWRLVYENVLGEFDFAAWFRTFLPSEEADRAAAGWGGCRYQLWEEGSRQSFLLSSRWDSAKDAREARLALERWLVERFPGVTRQDGSATTQQGAEVTAILDSQEEELKLVIAPSPALALELFQQLNSPRRLNGPRQGVQGHINLRQHTATPSSPTNSSATRQLRPSYPSPAMM